MAYYDTPSKFGDYRFVTLEDVINNFNVIYVGEDKLISKASRVDILFHAKRGLAELSYDVLKSFKAQEVVVPNTLHIPLPHDYVNYRAVTMVGADGIEKNLYPTGKTSNPFKVMQDSAGAYVLVQDDDDPTTDEIVGDIQEDPDGSTLASNFASRTEFDFGNDDSRDNYFIEAEGRRYGLDPQYSQQNGSFFIDYGKGNMHFGSSLAGETIVLHYVSDGLGDESEMVVHKFAEEAIYKWISYGILSSKSNIPEGIVQRAKKERFAEVRKAKMRLSNIKMEEFTQILKGKAKPIK